MYIHVSKGHFVGVNLTKKARPKICVQIQVVEPFDLLVRVTGSPSGTQLLTVTKLSLTQGH